MILIPVVSAVNVRVSNANYNTNSGVVPLFCWNDGLGWHFCGNYSFMH